MIRMALLVVTIVLVVDGRWSWAAITSVLFLL